MSAAPAGAKEPGIALPASARCGEEYSPADGRWQLRYVEPGVRPDQLGGLVVLAPTSPVAGFRNGDFVSVRGRVETNGGTSLPSYTATNVTPQRERR